jgi:hypothetical protein
MESREKGQLSKLRTVRLEINSLASCLTGNTSKPSDLTRYPALQLGVFGHVRILYLRLSHKFHSLAHFLEFRGDANFSIRWDFIC